MDLHAAAGEVYACWARGLLGDPKSVVRSMRKALKTYVAQGNRLFVFPYFQGLRAELEAETEGTDLAPDVDRRGLGARRGDRGARFRLVPASAAWRATAETRFG
jgi:hypothetical protein